MQSVVDLIDEVRLFRNRLVELATELNRDAGVTPPERAVLEYLHRSGADTVPGIARARLVTRQHIQTIVNDLQARQLVEPVPNPAHRRSPLIALRAEGADAIEGVLAGEGRYLAEHLAGVDENAVREAARTLADLRRRL
jgi:DNA-binding MarR family transcriptional regulator